MTKQWLTKYPDMPRMVPSEQQKEKPNLFREAAAYASSINRHPQKKAAYQKTIPKEVSVYHHALKEYLEKNKK